MSSQRWRVEWRDAEGRERAFLFDSLKSLMVARIDFALKWSSARDYEGEPFPEQYEITEVVYGGDQDTRSTPLRW